VTANLAALTAFHAKQIKTSVFPAPLDSIFTIAIQHVYYVLLLAYHALIIIPVSHVQEDIICQALHV
jgi:hypothetical protein